MNWRAKGIEREDFENEVYILHLLEHLDQLISKPVSDW